MWRLHHRAVASAQAPSSLLVCMNHVFTYHGGEDTPPICRASAQPSWHYMFQQHICDDEVYPGSRETDHGSRVSITIHEVSRLAGQAVCVTPALGAGGGAQLAEPPLRVLVGALGAVSTTLLPEAAQETQEHHQGELVGLFPISLKTSSSYILSFIIILSGWS